MKTAPVRGKWAESLALFYLMCKGYMPVARNFKTPVGEIDLIVRRGKVTVFVEVKFRETLEACGDAISAKQRSRITRAAQWFLKNKSAENISCRFDAVFVAKGKVLPKFQHITEAW